MHTTSSTTRQILNALATMGLAMCLMLTLHACADERVGNGHTTPAADGEEMVTISFSTTVPGMIAPTRAGETAVDEMITRMELYLFKAGEKVGEDTKYYLTDVVEPTFTHGNGQYGDATGEYTGNTGTYTATIPQNTARIHFVANYDRTKHGFNLTENKLRTEEEVLSALDTEDRIYWGWATTTYSNSNETMTVKNGNGGDKAEGPVQLYRNYAKVKVADASGATLTINGWTLYRTPQYAALAPDALTAFALNSLEKASLPIYAKRTLTPHDEADADDDNTTHLEAALNSIKASNDSEDAAKGKAHWMFEFEDKKYFDNGKPERPCALFKITKKNTSGEDETRYYKIELLKSTGEGALEVKTPYTVLRNHEYTITFKDINLTLGHKPTDDTDAAAHLAALKNAIEGPAANSSQVEVAEQLPEIIGSGYTLRIEDTGYGSTVRYFRNDDFTTTATTPTGGSTYYTFPGNLAFYFGPDDGTEEYNSSNLVAEWVNTPMPGTMAKSGDAWTDATTLTTIPIVSDGGNNYHLDLSSAPFTGVTTDGKHYKTGTIRIRETVKGVLSRYIKVYVGPGITFRPLLYSSDIPNEVDERLTILFSVPNENYLPSDLYPIDIRFGSDRVDVERNNYVEAMKVDVASNPDDVPAQHYTHVLRWQGTSSESTDWGWNPAATNVVKNSWGYEYVYTLETPAQAGEKRITLRTVSKSYKDFRVMMEGRSTVTDTPIFNTRELYFMMQNNGVATFNAGEWTTTTEGTADSKNRIMLKNGMSETRYVTAYVNLMPNANGDITIPIEYQLGTFDIDTKTASPVTPTEPVTIWAYYDASKLTPTATYTGATQNAAFTGPFTDTEGNTFIQFTHGTSSADGKVEFTAKKGTIVNNSMVFLTARNKAKYGKYDSSSFADGKVGYAYTGVNALAQSYRSAGAIINVKDTWELNPTPSITDGNYGSANSIALDYGSGKDLYVRIDRLANTSGVKLKIDTGGKFTLQSAPYKFTATDSNGNAITIDDYTFTDNGNGVYTVTLSSANTGYCILHFKSAAFNSASTISLTSVSDDPDTNENEASAVAYAPASVEVTNNAVAFAGFKYANEDDLAAASISYHDADADEKIHRTALPIKGSQVGVRVYFPSSMMNAGEFRFRLSSNCFNVVDTSTDTYSVEDFEADDNLIVKTNGNKLTSASDNLCYLDILLKSTKRLSTETVKFMGAGDSDDFHFYPHTVGLLCDNKKTYEATVMHHSDHMTNGVFTQKALSRVNATYGNSIVEYQIKLPNLGRVRTIPIKFTHNGYFETIESDKEGVYKYVSHTANELNLTVESAENSEKTIIIKQNITKFINNGEIIPIVINVGGDVVELEEDTLNLSNYLLITPTTWGANDTDNSLQTTSRGVVSGTVGNDKRISVSDFNETLTLTLTELPSTATSLTLEEGGAYLFNDGSTTQNITPTNGNAEITIKPQNGGELTDGTFTLTTLTDEYAYTTEAVTVYVRPYITYSTNLSEFTEVDNLAEIPISGIEGYKDIVVTIKVPDDTHDGKSISVEHKDWNSTALTLTSGPEGFTANGNTWTINSVMANKEYTFTWKAVSAYYHPIFKIEQKGETDLLRDTDYLNRPNMTNIYPLMYTYTTATFNFINDGASQGYIQYREQGTDEWINICGGPWKPADGKYCIPPLQANNGSWNSGDIYIPEGKTFDIRVTIPSNVSAREVTLSKDGTLTELEPTIETGKEYAGYAEFKGLNIADYNNSTIKFSGKHATKSASASVKMKSGQSIKVGVGTWDTAAEFDYVQVFKSGETVSNRGDNFEYNNSYKDAWRFNANGTWEYNIGTNDDTGDGTLKQTQKSASDCRALLDTQLPTGTDYTLKVRAKRNNGAEGFLIIFNCTDSNNYLWWNIGGWKNKQHGIEYCIDGTKTLSGASTAETELIKDCWYNIEIIVTASTATCTCTPEDASTGAKTLKATYNMNDHSTTTSIE